MSEDIFVPYDQRSLVVGPAQFWIAPHDADLPMYDSGKWAIDTTEDGVLSINKQTIELTNSPTGGAFTLAFHGKSTDALDFDITDAVLETALEGLATIGEGNVNVESSGDTFTVTFLNHLRRMHLPAFQVVDNSLTGAGDDPEVKVTRDWQEIGNKEDGLTMNQTEEQETHFVDEHLAPIERSRTAEGLVISCNVVNATLVKLHLSQPVGNYSQQTAAAGQTGYEMFGWGDGHSDGSQTASNCDPVFQGLIYAVNGMCMPYIRHVFRMKPLVSGDRAFQKGTKLYRATQWTAFAEMQHAPGQTLWRDYYMTELPTS